MHFGPLLDLHSHYCILVHCMRARWVGGLPPFIYYYKHAAEKNRGRLVKVCFQRFLYTCHCFWSPVIVFGHQSLFLVTRHCCVGQLPRCQDHAAAADVVVPSASAAHRSAAQPDPPSWQWRVCATILRRCCQQQTPHAVAAARVSRPRSGSVPCRAGTESCCAVKILAGIAA